MKVYVDELPRCCSECDIYKSYLGCCLTDFSRTTPKTERHNKCPLQTIADHDKEVRKQVCDEIRKSITQKDSKLEKSTYSDSLVSGYHCCYCDVKQILDQIEKGE